jgi:shikimate kinase
MKENFFDKIVLVTSVEKFTHDLGLSISQDLGMLFCDAKELIEYELVDEKVIEQLSSLEYLKRCEKKVAKHIASFENVVVSIGYDFLMPNINAFKDKSLIVFVKLPKNFVASSGTSLEALSYDERCKNMQEVASVSVSVRKDDISFVKEKIFENIRRMI